MKDEKDGAQRPDDDVFPSEPSDCGNTNTDDIAFDGMWPFSGYNGMMVQLAQEYVKFQEQQQHQEGTEVNGDCDEDEFVNLGNFDPSNEETIIRFQESLDGRDLHMADGVWRRLAEGCCPAKIRIRRLDDDITMKKLIEHKVQGNDHFRGHDIREAIHCYDLALSSIPETQRDLYVAPRNQIKEIVNVLSNKAECLLRKAKYEEAAETATDALIFMNDHEKSRIRRAKAGLEVGKYDRYEATSRGDGSMTGVAYLVQSKYDLEEVLDGPDSTLEGRETAEKLMSEVNRLLKNAKKKVLSKDPFVPWDLSVLKIQSRCW
mmetsp:Transcript_7518/g.18800  ORF Transcript_7518/g.18800 Transcript_7518/m.18800 type:complete len:318 (-) Transcript_7518:101-1054(-)